MPHCCLIRNIVHSSAQCRHWVASGPLIQADDYDDDDDDKVIMIESSLLNEHKSSKELSLTTWLLLRHILQNE